MHEGFSRFLSLEAVRLIVSVRAGQVRLPLTDFSGVGATELVNDAAKLAAIVCGSSNFPVVFLDDGHLIAPLS